MRSLLFVPGDSPRKFAKARTMPADVLILDLEDSVALEAKDTARQETCAMLAGERGAQKLFVRVNAFDTGLIQQDLAAVMKLRPDGIILPKSEGAADIIRLAADLDGFEAGSGAKIGATKIIAIATETAQAIFGLGTYKGASERLFGLMWGAEDLCAALGATTNSVDGIHTEPFRLARNLCLMAAAAAGVAAIDTIHGAIDDLAGLEVQARAARRDGFAAKAVIHPSHVASVNAAFTPSDGEVAFAERVIAAFAENPLAGAVRLDGAMIDKPHEKAARRILAQAGKA